MLAELLCALGLAASSSQYCAAEMGQVAGYVEGEYVHIAPLDTARIAHIAVARGSAVKKGDILVSMESADVELALAQANAALAAAQATLSNLGIGRRPEEIEVLDAQLRSARAKAVETLLNLDRQRELAQRGVIAKSLLETAESVAESAAATVQQADANLAVAKLPARPDEIEAARSKVAEARAARDQAAWKLGQRQLRSPADGAVTSLIRREGETAGPASPVLGILPQDSVKLIVYVPEDRVHDFALGARLAVGCDGCPDGLMAAVTYKAVTPEFTPPVIYSVGSRQKLVYRIEARPAENAAAHLGPGQIVDVRLGPVP